MPEPNAHEQLVGHLDELTERLAETQDTKERAAIALLIAQARKELEQAREVRGNVETPWWKSQLLYGVAIAAFAISAYFLEYVEPLLSKEQDISEARNRLQELENENQRVANAEQEIRNERQRVENEAVREQLEALTARYERLRAETSAQNESLTRQLEALEQKRKAEVSTLRSQLDASEDTSAEARGRLARLERELHETEDAIVEANTRAGQLTRHFIEFKEIEIVNCEGLAGPRTALFVTIKDEPVIHINGVRVWPTNPQSHACGDVHAIGTKHGLDQEENDVVIYEWDRDLADAAAMGSFSIGPLSQPIGCERAARAHTGALATTEGWCRSVFNAHDGEYVLVWRLSTG